MQLVENKDLELRGEQLRIVTFSSGQTSDLSTEISEGPREFGTATAKTLD